MEGTIGIDRIGDQGNGEGKNAQEARRQQHCEDGEQPPKEVRNTF